MPFKGYSLVLLRLWSYGSVAEVEEENKLERRKGRKKKTDFPQFSVAFSVSSATGAMTNRQIEHSKRDLAKTNATEGANNISRS